MWIPAGESDAKLAGDGARDFAAKRRGRGKTQSGAVLGWRGRCRGDGKTSKS